MEELLHPLKSLQELLFIPGEINIVLNIISYLEFSGAPISLMPTRAPKSLLIHIINPVRLDLTARDNWL